jgi:hypothetical protein
MRSNERDEIDALLEGGLREYANAEPRRGFEERVLRRLRGEGLARRRRRRWMVAVPALAGALLWIVLWRGDTQLPAGEAPAGTSSLTRPIAPSPAVRPGPLTAKGLVAVNRASTRNRGVPTTFQRQRSFPAPSSMTEEERALVQFVAHYPREAAQVSDALRPTAFEPLSFGPIRIEPLKNGS